MNNYNSYPQENTPNSQFVYQDVALQQSLVQRVFLWMTMGLAITGLTAYLTFESNLYFNIASSGMMWLLMLAELGVVMFLSARIQKIAFSTATILFGAYSILNGLTLSVLFAAYTMESLALTFIVTAGMFGATALYGYVTKRDLSGMGSILFMGVIGLIIAGVVNIFLGSSTLSLITSAAGIIIFTGLTAWDMQKIKHLFSGVYADSEEVKKLSVIGALQLYLDFVNLFIYLLRFFGKRR